MNLVLGVASPADDSTPDWIPDEVLDDTVIWATFDGIPAGVLALRTSRTSASITYYWVTPELRGLGIGQELIEAAVAEVRRLGSNALVVEVSPGDRLAKLAFEAQGFRTSRLVMTRNV